MGVIRRRFEKPSTGGSGTPAQPAADEKIVHLSNLAGFADDQNPGEPKSELAGLRRELEQLENEREEWMRAVAELLEEERELQMALELAEARMVPGEWIEKAFTEISAGTSSPQPSPVPENGGSIPIPGEPATEAESRSLRLEKTIAGLEAELSASKEREARALARADALEARLSRALEQLDSLRAAFRACQATE